jgi:hypothetical protein
MTFIQGIIIGLCFGSAIGFLIGALCKPFRDQVKRNTYDYIDWSKIPVGYDYVAVDGPKWITDTKVWAYKPDKNISIVFDKSQSWGPENDQGIVISATNAVIGELPPWRESLRKRPS